jgi:hypothetical protein
MMRKKGAGTATSATTSLNVTSLNGASAAAATAVRLKTKPPQLVVVLVLGMAVALFGLTLYKHHTHRYSTESMTFQDNNAVPNVAKKGKAATAIDQKAIAAAQAAIASIRQDFYKHYGGRTVAEQVYRQGLTAYGTKTATAERLLRILAASSDANKPTLSLSFGGYSVTVGRGNHYHQSYPMVLRDILTPLLQSTLNMNVKVRNAAIGGIPSFPYGFCLPHFLGTSKSQPVHLISWDYSMNEPNGQASILEAYIRHAILATSSSDDSNTPPLILVLDTHPNRCALLQKYVQAGYLGDALCVGMAKDALKNTPYASVLQSSSSSSLPDDDLPRGLQHWHDFGAAPSCPGRGNWHPKYQEHALIGWLVAMYFVDTLEVALDILSQEATTWRTKYGPDPAKTGSPPRRVEFGPPMEVVPPNNHPNVTSLLYGHVVGSQTATTTAKQYQMHAVQCRTNFLPATDATNDLVSIVVAGLASGAANAAADILSPRSDTMYASGWVVDVSDVERDTKIKVEACGGLGYVDMKIALYGIPSSGPLQLWLPVVDAKNQRNRNNDRDNAQQYVSELIVCEANEKRPKSACQLDTDLQYTVGGVVVATAAVSWIHGATEYLKRPTCVHVGIPESATLTPWSDQVATAATAKTPRRAAHRNDADKAAFGLSVAIRVSNAKVTREGGACCLSHVVWEAAAS